MNKIRFCVPCLFGLESVVNFEVRKIGGENITVTDGKVCFDGDYSTCAKANLWVASGERVLIELGTFTAKTFDQLFEAVRKLPLEDFVGSTDAFPVKGYSLNSQLHSIPDCQKIIKKACCRRLESVYGISYFEETGAKHQLQFSIMKDVVSLYIDTTGVGLHKRGYRKNANEAPIKETLAAGIVDFARIRGNSIVCDPMCGSGTLLIESAYKALNIAPGFRRTFAAQQWQQVPQTVWQEARKEAAELVNREGVFKAFGYDISDEAVVLTRENAVKAGIEDRVSVRMQDIRKFEHSSGSITLCNPPYGERMLEVKEAEELYKIMGEKLHPDRDNPCYIIAPHEEFEQYFGKKADKKRKLYNGMIKCSLYMYFK